jgi:hypothetical protein
MPIADRKRRVSVRGLIAPRTAKSSTVMPASRFAWRMVWSRGSLGITGRGTDLLK